MFLSITHGANNARSCVGVFTMMLALHESGVITETVQIHFVWRVMHAVGMTIGTVFLGFRLAPVAGEPALPQPQPNTVDMKTKLCLGNCNNRSAISMTSPACRVESYPQLRLRCA